MSNPAQLIGQGGAVSCGHASDSQDDHAANDPWSASTACVTSVANVGPCQLYYVVQCNQEARDGCRQCVFHDHNSIEGIGR